MNSLHPAARSGVPSAAHVASALVREVRPKQWLKNAACLAGLVFSGRLFVGESLAAAGLGLAVFCLAASAVYVFNDLVDLEKDRLNPRTARRPLASGELPVPAAAVACYALVAASLAGSFFLGWACTVTLAVYVGMNVLYCLRLKHQVIAVVMCIALGFVLRVLFGVFAVGVKPTAWIVTCMFFLALFLGFAKRRAELACLGQGAPRPRPVLEKYQIGYLDLLLAMSATMTILCYALFTVASHRNPTLIITVLPVVYCITHYLLRVTVAGLGQSPEEMLLSDRALWGGIACWVVLCVLVLYGDLHFFAEKFEILSEPGERLTR